MCDCLICKRIELIKNGQNPYFVREMKTGYVVIGDYQRIKGYTLFLCKEHATELFHLEPQFRKEFLWEMSVVAQAVQRTFEPDKINYELLGTGDAVHMHWHIFPRYEGDTPERGPIWKLPVTQLYGEQYLPSAKELKQLTTRLNKELDDLLN